MNKLKSRKFVVWMTTCVFCISAVIITKTATPELINCYTLISMIYIGGNIGSSYLRSKNKGGDNE